MCISLYTIIVTHNTAHNSSDYFSLLNSRQSSELWCCLLEGRELFYEQLCGKCMKQNTLRKSIVSSSRKRIRDDVLRSSTSDTNWLKYLSILDCNCTQKPSISTHLKISRCLTQTHKQLLWTDFYLLVTIQQSNDWTLMVTTCPQFGLTTHAPCHHWCGGLVTANLLADLPEG